MLFLTWRIALTDYLIKYQHFALYPGPTQLSIIYLHRGESLEMRLGMKSKQWMVSGSLGHFRNHAVKQPKINTQLVYFADLVWLCHSFYRPQISMGIKPDTCFQKTIFHTGILFSELRQFSVNCSFSAADSFSKKLIRESVDSLCRDGANLQSTQAQGLGCTRCM